VKRSVDRLRGQITSKRPRSWNNVGHQDPIHLGDIECFDRGKPRGGLCHSFVTHQRVATINEKEIHKVDNKEVMEFRDSMLPLIRLRNVLSEITSCF